MINKTSNNVQEILMMKINMMQDLLDNQEWPEDTEKKLKEKLQAYRAKLANLLLMEKLA